MIFKDLPPPALASKILQNSSIFCLTSRIEGFGIVLVEAERSGAVPIAFDSYPVAKELIDNGVNGILIRPFDEDEYSKQLAKLMSNPVLLNTMSIAGIEKSKNYTVDKIMSQWMTLYNDLLLTKLK